MTTDRQTTRLELRVLRDGSRHLPGPPAKGNRVEVDADTGWKAIDAGDAELIQEHHAKRPSRTPNARRPGFETKHTTG